MGAKEVAALEREIHFFSSNTGDAAASFVITTRQENIYILENIADDLKP